MKALFITTRTADCHNHVRAWNSFSNTPAEHFTFDHQALRNDHLMIEAARRVRPDVIFYIGAVKALGNPRPETLRELMTIAPSVNICSDAADRPWHPVLEGMKRLGCFNAQVSIDGANRAPVDIVTLTPIDPRPFEAEEKRDIRCGFSGSIGRWNARSEVIRALVWFGGLIVRDRAGVDAYEDHARFMKRCRMILNLSYTGSGHAHHIKGRVLEAGWAGCALLESEGSPIGEWFPSDCYITFRDPKDAAAIIADLDDAAIEKMARRLSEEVRSKFTPAMIYGAMMKRLPGFGRGKIEKPNVADPVQAPAA